MGAKTLGDYPRNLGEFYKRFPDEEACLRYLFQTRWPKGYMCRNCGGRDVWAHRARRRWECRSCGYQQSITAGTVLHGTRTPLRTWFAAAFLVSSHKPGMSALQLQQLVGIKRYDTAWLLLHKLRRAMVNPDRSKLTGEIEVDETWVGGKQAGLKGGRQRKDRKALAVVAAVERRANATDPKRTHLGRLRMEIIPDFSADTLQGFVRRNVEAGSTIYTDAWDSYDGLAKGYKHHRFSQRQAKLAGQPATAVPGIDRVVSNLKTWLRGTHHGVGADHLDYYLNEFVFRFNRRFHPAAGFATLLGLSADLPPTTTAQIQSPKPGTGPRRRGRSTGLTTGRFSVQVGESKTLEQAIARIEQTLEGDPTQPGTAKSRLGADE